MSEGRKHLFDEPRNRRRLVHGLVAACVILLGLELLLPSHEEHPWEGIFGFYPLYGFGACILLVLLAKELRKLLQRREDYYERREAGDD